MSSTATLGMEERGRGQPRDKTLELGIRQYFVRGRLEQIDFLHEIEANTHV